MRRRLTRPLAALLASFVLAAGCSSGSDGPESPAADDPNSIKLVFTYGSEKETWIKEVTDAFNARKVTTGGGKRIFVDAIPMGSGECVDEILSGARKPDLISPASAAFISVGNAQSRVSTGRDLVGPSQNLVLSPVVIAMWRPMAEALGWGKKPIGWADVLAVSRNPQGWAAYGQPQWGSFKFGHTHPEFSNSGLATIVAEAYAATGKVSGLTVADLSGAKVAGYVADIEKSVVHYGSSTGFFGQKMFSNGPQYLSAAVLYENMVIDAYSGRYQTPFPVVAIYPKEGTFWSDHPAAVVDREWVTPERREAAETYVRYLLDRPQQERALAYGFRPANPDLALAAPVDTAHGVDPSEPKTTLEVPQPDVIDALLALWRTNKRATNVVLVLDTSGSMKEENRLENAKAGATEFVDHLADVDTLSFLPFNTTVAWSFRDLSLATDRARAKSTIASLFPTGGTALYDAVDQAYTYLLENPHPDRISAVVVLTDGADRDSRRSLDALLANVRFDAERRTTRVFTIGYGAEANADILRRIADATQAKYFDGSPQNIRSVFREISTFF